MRSSRILFIAVLLLWSACFPVLAALGGEAATLQADQIQLGATRRIVSSESYLAHQLVLPSGTVVTEYLSRAGTVFGLAWHGPLLPNLENLLGTYYGEYLKAVESEHAGHGPVTIYRQGLVVHSEGHMRAFAGKAYLPELLPHDVAVEELR